MAKKKREYFQSYMPNTHATNNKELIDLIERCDYIVIKDQAMYDDQTEHITIQIHSKIANRPPK